jgi:hypothetical protein
MASMETRDYEPGFVGNNRPQLTQHVTIPQRAERDIFFGRYRQTESGLGIIEPSALADLVRANVSIIVSSIITSASVSVDETRDRRRFQVARLGFQIRRLRIDKDRD